MRTITKQLVLLFVVFVIYFGYTAFVDGVAIYHLTDTATFTRDGVNLTVVSGTLMGSSNWTTIGIYYDTASSSWLTNNGWTLVGDPTGVQSNVGDIVGGYMSPTSLLYTLLSPFKLVLVGAVFASLIPLTKQIFFGTVSGIRSYLKARRTNILFNYQTTIAFATDLNATLVEGDYEKIKAKYGAFAGLAFKPTFLQNMMDEIGDSLIRETDLKIYIKPSAVVIASLKEMYEKEKKAMVSMKPDEMFFDFKRGYEYISIGSKYTIAYYKNLDSKHNSQKDIGWKLFSLEMFRFYIYMLLSIIPTIIIALVVLPILSKYISSASTYSVFIIIVTFFAIAIVCHAIFTFTKSDYKNMKKSFIVPAVVYYMLMLILSLTFSFGIYGITKLGSIVADGSAMPLMWPFFAALGYTVLSTCLILYIIATLMDGYRSNQGMSKKLFIDGVILPAIACFVASVLNFTGVAIQATGADVNDLSTIKMLSGIAFGVTIAFWVYLSISGIVLNNIVFPSRKKREARRAMLAQQGLDAQKEKEKSSKKSK